MLDKYIVAVETNTAEENVILISRDDYNVFAHEPITGSDNLEEAEKLFAEVKELGVQKYFDKIIAQSSHKSNYYTGVDKKLGETIAVKRDNKTVGLKLGDGKTGCSAKIYNGKVITYKA